MYAQCGANNYDVSFNNNGGSGGQSSVVTATYGQAMPSISSTAPTLAGYTFKGWYDTQTAPVGATSCSGTQYYTAAGASARNYDKASNTTLYACFIDETNPTGTISGGTAPKVTSQTVTIKCSDAAGVTAYYWGTTKPTTADAITTTDDLSSVTSSSGKSITGLTHGTYYLGCRDAKGNINSTTSIVIRRYKVARILQEIQSTGTYTSSNYVLKATSSWYYVKNGTSLAPADIWETGTAADASTYLGYTTAAASDTPATLLTGNVTVSSNSVIHYMWFNRKRFAVTITKSSQGSITATADGESNVTLNQVSVATNASSNGVLNVMSGDTVTAQATAATGRTFTSWSGGYISGSTNPATGTEVKAAKTITANYDTNVYDVVYDCTSNGGTGTIATATVAYGSAINLPSTGCTKSGTGWTFLGWNTDQNAHTVLSNLNMGIADVHLYAIYKKAAITLTATWNANGATFSSTPATSCTLAEVYNNVTQATSCTITATVTRTGYTVKGFNTSATAHANNASYNTSNNKLTLTSSNTGQTWYAITQANTGYTATFSANNGATVSTGSVTCYKFNQETTCDVTAPTVSPQDGFTHFGFNTSASATTNNSAYNTQNNTLTISANGTWYPLTKKDVSGTFTVQNTTAASKSGGSPNCTRYNGAANCTITAPTLTSNNTSLYEVIGWDESANSHTAAYAASGATITLVNNTTFYSITKFKTAIVATFDKNTTYAHVSSQTPSGGTASTNNTVTSSCYRFNNETECSITSPAITPSTGYTAVGYNTTASATTSTWNVSTAKNVSANVTYYAITKGKTYTVVYDCGTGTGTPPSTQTATYGTTFTVTTGPGSCTKSGYVFAGWYDNAASPSAWSETSSPWTGWSGTWSFDNGNYGITNNRLNLTAHWSQEIWSENIAHSGQLNTCEDAQCMVDAIWDLIK